MLFDLRDILKSLSRTPGYAATVIVTLALTIGATTAVFSIVNSVLLKPLAYRESHQLVSLREVWQQMSRQAPLLPVNEQHFEYWRRHTQTLAAMAQYLPLPANLTGRGAAAEIAVVHTSGSLFDVLETPAALGRTLTPDDEDAARPKVAVLTDRCWRERFGADPASVGGVIVLDGTPHTIVGVLPAGFRIPDGAALSDAFDAFVPIRMQDEQVGWVGDHNTVAIGRLKAGVAAARARAELDLLQAQVSDIATKEAHEPVTLSAAVTPLTETIVGRARRGLWLLLAAIAAVLLIACSNIANLALTRSVSRQREAAIRSALGASGSRLVGLAVAEQLMLSAAGGALGLWVAWGALALFVRTAPIDLPRVGEVALDRTVLAFCAGLSIATGLLVAILPAARLASGAAQAGLRISGPSFTADRAATRTRASLLALQVAISVALLAVTALLSLSFVRLLNVDRGFDAAQVLAVPVAFPANRYAEEPVRRAAYDRTLASIRDLPGVESATTTSMIPLRGEGQVNFVSIAGDTRPRSAQPTANFRFVAPDFFRTLGVPVVRGRSFTDGERDPARPAPAVVSQRTADRLWPGRDAVGQRFSRGIPGEQGFEVVGVVGDARTTSLETPPPLMVYAPYWWRSRSATTMLIRTAVEPASLMPAVRRAVAGIDPDIAIGDARPLEQVVAAALAPRRYQMRLFLAFGTVALLIATIGVYATTAYGVSRRRREMNIRVALGAAPSQVLRLVLRQGTGPVAIGIAAGAVGALGLGDAVASLLFGVGARDPLVIGFVVVLVGAVAFGASVVAARQGLVINPASALREE